MKFKASVWTWLRVPVFTVWKLPVEVESEGVEAGAGAGAGAVEGVAVLIPPEVTLVPFARSISM